MLAQLIPLVEAQPRAEWHQLVADLQREFPCPIPKACDPLSHYGLINAVAACVDDMRLSPPTWVSIRCGPRKPSAQSPTPVLTSAGWARWFWPACGDWRRWRTRPQSVVLLRRRQPDDEYSEMATASENQLDVKIDFDEQRSAGAGASATESVLLQGVLPLPIRAKSTLCRLPPDSASKPVI